MSLHNYTNPAFCQQSEFYPSPGNSVPKKSPIKIYRSESVRSFKQTTRIRQHEPNYAPVPPKVGPKPQINLSHRYAERPVKNTYDHVNASPQKTTAAVEYALVPLTEIPNSSKGRYACIPADDVRKIQHNSTRFTRSQDDLDRFSSLPANVNDHDDSVTSLPPCPTQDNPRLKTAFSSDFRIDQNGQQRAHDNSRLQTAFSSDFGNKSFIVVDQTSQQRYEMVPTEEDEELVDANHEIIQMHNGRAHRYAMIPTDDEETCLSSEIEMSPIRNSNNYATIKESPRYQPPYQRTYVHQSPQKDRPPATPTKNTLVTQKLHELLSTPQKPQLHRQGSTLRATPVRQNPQILSSTPKQNEFTPQKLRYEQHQPNASQCEQRTTAVISPRLASLATYVEPSSVGDNSSWKSLSFQKVTNATATIGAVSLMLILCGIMNSGLCLYMIADFGRIYYLDIGVISGFAATALGILGFKSRQCDWLPNRNYISGYILVTVFSLLNCCGLLVLLSLRPLPGDPIHDVTTGILLGLSFLTLFMISLGVITSRWCRSPPPDNRVMKALCYAAKLVSGLYVSSNADTSKKFAIFSSKISGARATLRLIDDIPMLKYTLEYGWGQKEPDRAMSVLGVVANFVDHLYYPIEKVCWLIEHNLLNVTNPTKWDTLSSVFWVSSIYLNLMRTIRMVALIEQHKHCVSSEKSDSSGAMEKLINNQRMEVISVIRLSLDLIQAGSTLPKGYLWGGKLETWHVGLVGTLSAFIGIYQYFAKKKMAK